MLCLTRKNREWIDIVTTSGERIEVCLANGWNGRARLGFVAPESVQITRREVTLAKANGTSPLAERLTARRNRKESA